MLGLGCARPSITTCACDDGHRNYHGSGRREPVATNRPAAPTSPYRPNHSATNARERGRASAPASHVQSARSVHAGAPHRTEVERHPCSACAIRICLLPATVDRPQTLDQ